MAVITSPVPEPTAHGILIGVGEVSGPIFGLILSDLQRSGSHQIADLRMHVNIHRKKDILLFTSRLVIEIS